MTAASPWGIHLKSFLALFWLQGVSWAYCSVVVRQVFFLRTLALCKLPALVGGAGLRCAEEERGVKVNKAKENSWKKLLLRQ